MRSLVITPTQREARALRRPAVVCAGANATDAISELQRTQPEAATELYRLLIDSILEHGRSAAYGHAARYLEALDGLTEDPEAYRGTLRRLHGRKAAFWSQVRD